MIDDLVQNFQHDKLLFYPESMVVTGDSNTHETEKE